jgi:hypothetical protein
MHLSLNLDNSTTGGYFETANQVEHSCYQTKYYKSRLENSVAGASSVIITSDNYNLPRPKKINTLLRWEYPYLNSIHSSILWPALQLTLPSPHARVRARESSSTRNDRRATSAKSAALGARQKVHTSRHWQPRKSRPPRIETIVLPKTSAGVDRSLH